MQTGKTSLIAAGMIAIAILGHGLLTRYSATGGEGQAVWRIDTITGKVSMCGSTVNGPFLAESAASMGEQPTPKDKADFAFVTTPRCSPWSAP